MGGGEGERESGPCACVLRVNTRICVFLKTRGGAAGALEGEREGGRGARALVALCECALGDSFFFSWCPRYAHGGDKGGRERRPTRHRGRRHPHPHAPARGGWQARRQDGPRARGGARAFRRVDTFLSSPSPRRGLFPRPGRPPAALGPLPAPPLSRGGGRIGAWRAGKRGAPPWVRRAPGPPSPAPARPAVKKNVGGAPGRPFLLMLPPPARGRLGTAHPRRRPPRCVM